MDHQRDRSRSHSPGRPLHTIPSQASADQRRTYRFGAYRVSAGILAVAALGDPWLGFFFRQTQRQRVSRCRDASGRLHRCPGRCPDKTQTTHGIPRRPRRRAAPRTQRNAPGASTRSQPPGCSGSQELRAGLDRHGSSSSHAHLHTVLSTWARLPLAHRHLRTTSALWDVVCITSEIDYPWPTEQTRRGGNSPGAHSHAHAGQDPARVRRHCIHARTKGP